MTPISLINTSVQDANIMLDIQVTRSPLAALELITQTFKVLETQENPRHSLRKALARAARNALKQLQNAAQEQN